MVIMGGDKGGRWCHWLKMRSRSDGDNMDDRIMCSVHEYCMNKCQAIVV